MMLYLHKHMKLLHWGIILLIITFGLGYISGNAYAVTQIQRALSKYDDNHLDLSFPYIGVRPVTLRYLYSLKQGIFQAGTATVSLRGRVLAIGSNDDIKFQIHLRHVSDRFENMITPDVYNNARITAVYASGKQVEELSWDDVSPGDVIDMVFTLDLMNGVEVIESVTVQRE